MLKKHVEENKSQMENGPKIMSQGLIAETENKPQGMIPGYSIRVFKYL